MKKINSVTQAFWSYILNYKFYLKKKQLFKLLSTIWILEF